MIVDGEVTTRGGCLAYTDESRLIAGFCDVHAELLDRIQPSARGTSPKLEWLKRVYARRLEESVLGDVTYGMIG